MRTSTHKLAALVLAFVLALTLGACGNSGGGPNDDGDSWAPDIQPQDGYQLYYYLGGAYAIQVPDSWLIIDAKDLSARGLEAILGEKLDDPASFKLDEATVKSSLTSYDAIAYDLAQSDAEFIPYACFGSSENSVLHQTILKEESIMASLQNEVQRNLADATAGEVEVREEVTGEVLGQNYFLQFCFNYSMAARDEDGVAFRALTANAGRIYWVNFTCSESQFSESWKQSCRDIMATLEFYSVPEEYQPADPDATTPDTTTPTPDDDAASDNGGSPDTDAGDDTTGNGDDSANTDQNAADNTGGEDAVE